MKINSFPVSVLDMELLLWETTAVSLESVLLPYAFKILRYKKYPDDLKVAALDYVGRVGEDGSGYDFQKAIKSVVRNSNYPVATIALETFVELFGTIATDTIGVSCNSELLSGEIASYNYLTGRINRDDFLAKLENMKKRHLEVSCWRISRILFGSAKGRSAMRNAPFFSSEHWLAMLRKHGRRGVFPEELSRKRH